MNLVAGLTTIALTACGSGAASPETKVVPPRALNAEVCNEGEGRDAKVYLRNLDDFEWGDYTFSLTKNGNDYTYASGPLATQDPDVPESWLPESQRTSEPFTNSRDFGYDAAVTGFYADLQRSQDNTSRMISRMHNFTSLEGAKIVISKPFPGEWTGDVQPC